MISEIMAEASPSESDESEDWESDEAFDESDESDEGVEDIGERARRKRRGRQSRSRFVRQHGVKGVSVRRPDGNVAKMQFPAKLATAEETNRGLASQELGRRALEEKVAQLEKSLGRQRKDDSSVAGLVTLGIGGSLAAHGVIKAKEEQGGLTLKNWTDQTSTEMATLISVTQLATSGAKLVVKGRYLSSGVGMAADIYAVAQIATFAFGHFSPPPPPSPPPPAKALLKFVADIEAAKIKAVEVAEGTLLVTGTGQTFRVVVDENGVHGVAL